MSNFLKSKTITVALAIFSMFFGAGNIIYPLTSGILSGNQYFIGIFGFILTAVLLPLIGLISMVLFNGDYKSFFSRIGDFPGKCAIFFCMLVIGPLLAMPRCITVPYDMIYPFLPSCINLPIFSIIFAILIFSLTIKESKLLEILGNIISPALVISLSIIIIKGIVQNNNSSSNQTDLLHLFFTQLTHGFQTLDLLGGIFFAYVIIMILEKYKTDKNSTKDLISTCIKSGLIASILLALVYIGFGYLGAFYGNNLSNEINGAETFRLICLQIIPKSGVLILITAVLMACISTIAALAIVTAEYLKNEIFKNKISYATGLSISLICTTIISNFGLNNILKYGKMPINIGYPIIITIVFCNLAYKLFKFKPIKIPVLCTTIAMLAWYLFF